MKFLCSSTGHKRILHNQISSSSSEHDNYGIILMLLCALIYLYIYYDVIKIIAASKRRTCDPRNTSLAIPTSAYYNMETENSNPNLNMSKVYFNSIVSSVIMCLKLKLYVAVVSPVE